MKKGSANNSRRDFIKKTSLAAGFIPMLGSAHPLVTSFEAVKALSVHIFSKHLQFLNVFELGQKVAELGFDGVDLTVRPGGHVEPASVKKDLPIAIDPIKKGGSQCIMMTTAVENVENQLDVDVLESASKLGVDYYRLNWFRYSKTGNLVTELNGFQQNVTDLSNLNKKLKLIGCYQNHAGTHVGSSLWEVKKLLENAELASMGVQYDIRHAVVEGGMSWENGLRLVQENIKTVVLKDFKWGQVNGIWKVVSTPIGAGMVNFDAYFKLLKKYSINVPVSLHLEYEIGNEAFTKEENERLLYEAMRKDLEAVQLLWEKA